MDAGAVRPPAPYWRQVLGDGHHDPRGHQELAQELAGEVEVGVVLPPVRDADHHRWRRWTRRLPRVVGVAGLRARLPVSLLPGVGDGLPARALLRRRYRRVGEVLADERHELGELGLEVELLHHELPHLPGHIPDPVEELVDPALGPEGPVLLPPGLPLRPPDLELALLAYAALGVREDLEPLLELARVLLVALVELLPQRLDLGLVLADELLPALLEPLVRLA